MGLSATKSLSHRHGPNDYNQPLHGDSDDDNDLFLDTHHITLADAVKKGDLTAVVSLSHSTETRAKVNIIMFNLCH
jgi:hypothetical protein